MRGSIVKKGSKWYIVVDIKDGSGKRKQKWIFGFRTKKEAEKALPEILNKIQNNNFIMPKDLTVAEYLRQWLDTYGRENLAKTTLEVYKINIVL